MMASIPNNLASRTSAIFSICCDQWDALRSPEPVTDTKLYLCPRLLRDEQRDECATTIRVLAPVKIREVREAANEIDARFLKGAPYYDEALLLDCEEWLILREA